MKTLDEYFDGELHQLEPEEDWEPVDVTDPELTPRQARVYGSERGWSSFVVRLQRMANALGGTYYAVQKNIRNEKGELVETRYLFQYKGPDREGVRWGP